MRAAGPKKGPPPLIFRGLARLLATIVREGPSVFKFDMRALQEALDSERRARKLNGISVRKSHKRMEQLIFMG
jgi:hypothetical protein